MALSIAKGMSIRTDARLGPAPPASAEIEPVQDRILPTGSRSVTWVAGFRIDLREGRPPPHFRPTRPTMRNSHLTEAPTGSCRGPTCTEGKDGQSRMCEVLDYRGTFETPIRRSTVTVALTAAATPRADLP